jgi:hypothetical protein
MVATKRLQVPLNALSKTIEEIHRLGYLDALIHFPGCKHKERQGVESAYVVIILWGRRK